MTQRHAFVLDAFALLAHLQDEPAAAQVEDILRSGDALYMSSINLGEVFYRTARTRGIERAEGALALIARGPVDVVDPDRDVVLAAAWLKARHRISYADCFAAALAQRLGATLLTGDRDFERLEDDLTIEWLPG